MPTPDPRPTNRQLLAPPNTFPAHPLLPSMATTPPHDADKQSLPKRLRAAQDWFRDRLLPLRMCLGRKITSDAQRTIVRISRTRLVKGPCSQQELEAMRYAAAHTSVPVPRVRGVHRLRRGLFIVMDYIAGESLADVWPGLAAADKARTAARIWACLGQLHACRPPSSLGAMTAASIGGGPVRDGALGVDEAGAREMGPFAGAEEFAAVVAGRECVEGLRLAPAEVVFVHADICPRNIILGRDGNLWFIDWEFAGWWPMYWERVKWTFSDFPPTPDFVALLDEQAAKAHGLSDCGA
ncbi:hypothetical protein E4U53_003176 [Claviceps sorghi]|nr:hypothetical protein E4U53_003176 [Claviceps sorghi]